MTTTTARSPRRKDAATTTTAPLPAGTRPEGDGEDARIDVGLLHDVLDGRWAEEKRATRALASNPDLLGIPGLHRDEHRARVLDQLKMVAAAGVPARGFPESVGGGGTPGGYLAGFDELVHLDPSLQIKAGVQFGLFASAILHLGTEDHHLKWLPGALDVSLPGCFAMTEIGHGSDVAGVLTTAVYEPGTREFVIHTPVDAARKEYIGNAALHGQAAVVFARLITAGVDHGVHAFFVPIREAGPGGEMVPCAGVSFEDDGHKGGLNGIDNGRIRFEKVRIPRVNLLNRYGDVAEDGTYSSPIDSPARRFFTMISTLVQGRVSISGGAVAASRAALAIAVRYGTERRQFAGANPDEETVLMDYQRHQRRLLPHLAAVYAATFHQEKLLGEFHAVMSGENDTDEARQLLETQAAGTKAVNTWRALDVIQEAREACGGAGYMAENRLVGLRADLDVFVTFEGDNTVLLQLVGKRLLTDYARAFAKADTAGKLRWVAGQAAEVPLYKLGLVRAAQTVQDTGSPARSAGQLRDPDTQRDLLAERVAEMVEEIALALRAVRRDGTATAVAVVNDHQHRLVEVARASAELAQWDSFTEALEAIPHGATRRVLTRLRDLYGLTLIERDLAWYPIHGRLSAQRAGVVSGYVDRLLAWLRPHARDLVDAFGLSDDVLRAPIALGAEERRQSETREYLRQRRASGEDPVPEASLSAAQKRSTEARATP